ncbi:MAG: hypothetical protein IT162_12335 [Bryobacterales bacterium]|nr:hypothetical protein [Bryobacterales bacterium]
MLGAGAALAAGVFAWLYVNNPAGFVAGWSADLTVASSANNQQHHPGAGRFSLQWDSTWRTARQLFWLEPVVAALAAMRAWQAMRARRAGGWLGRVLPGSVWGWWLAGGLGFLGVQRYVADQHRLVLMLPLCALAAGALAEWAGEGRTWWKQPRLWLAAAAVLSAGRMAVGAWRLPDEHTAVAWLAEQTRGQTAQRVMAAPYILMQLDAQPVRFFALPPPHVPSPAALRAQGVDWLAVDEREWGFHSRTAGAAPETMEAALQGCCRLVFDTARVRVYKVNGGAGSK